MNDILDKYNTQEVEAKWQNHWEQHKVYKWDPSKDRSENFVIDTPPPTVSGILHMGHIFSYTQADFIARFMRMKGKNVFYPIGFDDNGLPTEKLVEKTKNVRGVNLPRNEFIALCREVVLDAEEEFRKLFRSAAMSFDWDQEYQTISPEVTKLSQMSFIDLYNKGHIYRSQQPTLWDTIDQTALAQADIIDKEFDSEMHEIIFKTEDNQEIVIATTRPELLPACVAVMIHPDDPRHKSLLGKTLKTPLFEISVRVIADEKVEIEKGTGVVMCCTFGDTTDIEWWRIHNLPLRQIIAKNGRLALNDLDYIQQAKINDQAKPYLEAINGLKIKEAREKIIELLKANGLLTKSSSIVHIVKCAERSGSPLEILVTSQWSVKILEHKKELLNKAKECKWYPEYMQHRLENWINGLSWDWCISRQRFFGVPFPVWYSKRPGEEGKVIIGNTQKLPIDPLHDLPAGYSKEEVEPDFDVMDTWATSSITPQLSSKAITKEFAIDYERHQKLYPADLRPQAHEIIRTWAFYTMVKSHLHENTIPWKSLMISGWCLAADKTKMSKSKGNVVTPVNLIQEKGADIVRFWAANSRLGADIAYSEEMFKIGKKLVTKLWNASKFCAQYFSGVEINNITAIDAYKNNQIFELVDIWMLSKLNEAVKNATLEFEKFEYCNAKAHIENFFWNIFCDNYLEIIKVRAYDENDSNPQGKLSAVYSLYYTLSTVLKLFAPLLPHVTEEIYQALYPKEVLSIHQRNTWPEASNLPYDQEAVVLGDYLVELLEYVRKTKSEANISLKAPIKEIWLACKDKNVEKSFSKIITDFKNVTQAEELVVKEFDTIDKGVFNGNNELKLQIIT
ncbi:valine--tRNA ligase [Rickettsiales endosymbiont of Stachyamoeba lipophora]|uniref:valine--tRNA ligase n=1 Tax=Rickettsiales endosymbiont of Stachyamoeba lipophora TaxID=2486578 RepID=UPI000F654FDC|nr:valine--tRNA ligase [Rickettsiales endosymbiont of Stachyamoeba lipophora]AZL15644.1 valine--tRNA ligase [Rickettsiales endosymbiont of Stachyamoeba lipophora]